MQFGTFDPAELEIRKRRDGSRRLRGRFPYGKKAVLSDGGRNGGKPQKEQFAPGAFSYRLNLPGEDIHLLSGHDYNKPLASRATDTLKLRDTAEALLFEADITPQVADTSHGADAIALIEAGLSVGISPGFRIPPPRAVPPDQAEKITTEAYDPSRRMFGATIRTILAALLYELSVVTRPAYQEATIEPVRGDPPAETYQPDREPIDEDGDGFDDVTGEEIVPRQWRPVGSNGLVFPTSRVLARWRP